MMNSIKVSAIILPFLHSVLAVPQPRQYENATCHHLPGDAEWPSDNDWKALNSSIRGKLIRGVPLAQPCYNPDFNAAACAKIREDWTMWDL
jgi:hypothetical protein